MTGLAGIKPKPLPKPRPWSIVGVDRKSGEVTSVGKSDRKSDELKAPGTSKNSVRDLINNMNKTETTTPAATSAAETKQQQRKVSSLPRGTQPPGSGDSPKTGKKISSTSDDPRILKLEDDYSYEGVMDV
jgi:hypothetical protein